MGKLINDDEVPRVAMQVTQDVLVVSIQIELYDASLKALREDLLDSIYRTGVRQALIDLSAVEVMDSYAYVSICDIANMAKVMGTNAVLTGIKAGVASALVELNVDVKRTDTALNIEAGLALLNRQDDGGDSGADEQEANTNESDSIPDDSNMEPDDPIIENGTSGAPGTAAAKFLQGATRCAPTDQSTAGFESSPVP